MLQPQMNTETHRNHQYARGKWRAFTLVELLVVIAIIGTLAGLLLPAVQQAREAGRRSQCSNNLRQLALGLQNYESTYRCFPPSYIADTKHPSRDPNTYDGPSGFAWGAMLLPQIEQQSLHDRFDFRQPCWSAVNAPAALTTLKVFLCPSSTGKPGPFDVKNSSGAALARFSRADYVASAGMEEPWGFTLEDWSQVADGAMYRNSPTRPADVTDGLSNTVFLGEHSSLLSSKTWVGVVPGAKVCANRPDRFPITQCDAATTLVNVHSGPASGEFDPVTGFAPIHPPNSPLCHVCQMYAEHPAGCNVALGDGSVRFISQFIHQPTWAALSSRASGDLLQDY
jgi:prepilin-type N-terminal cleavage/methylation domain-containing protein